MIDGTAALARRIAFLQGPAQEELGMAHGLQDILALAKPGGYCCGQGAARAVIVDGMDPWLGQIDRVFSLPEEFD